MSVFYKLYQEKRKGSAYKDKWYARAVNIGPEGKEPFEVGRCYFGASLSSLNLSYSGASKTNFGVAAKVGYLVDDNLMLLFDGGFNHDGNDGIADYMHVGLGARYYIQQNGLFLGANCQYAHARHNYNDVMPGVEVGYAFFISRTVTIEPSIYYQQSIKNHSDYSTIGLRLGFGIYLE